MIEEDQRKGAARRSRACFHQRIPSSEWCPSVPSLVLDTFEPSLTAITSGGVGLVVDEAARERGVIVGFTDRTGGVSEAPYATLNLSLSTGDRGDDVLENRRRAVVGLGLEPDHLVLTRQQHGTTVLAATERIRGLAGDGDGLVTRDPGPVLGMLAADCACVVVAGAEGLVVAHAGWRGLAAGMVPAAVAAVAPAWAAWVGPAIGACCYEVGPEVVAAFERAGLPVAASGSRVDVGAAAVASLRAAGVDRVASVGECTACGERWFSHRRDHGRTGRHGVFATLVDGGSARGRAI